MPTSTDLTFISSGINVSDYQNIGIALLTVLIPLGVAVLSDYFKKADDKVDYAELDLQVILDRVLTFKYLLFDIGLIFVPLLFWGYAFKELRYAIIIIFLIGTLHLLGILFNFYNWIKGNKEEMRLEYFKGLQPGNDLIKSSRSIWNSTGMGINDEKKFFKELFKNINKLLNHE